MANQLPLIIRILRSPGSALELDLPGWDLLIRQARAAGLLGHLHGRFDAIGLLDQVPERPRAHLASAHILATRHHEIVAWEADRIRHALAHPTPLDVPVVLLKGAAYVVAGLPPAKGRLFNDVDIMVPKARITEVEARLRDNGWISTHLSPYDQRYYRRWMHELPPMQHLRRKTTLDVHHTILPETARVTPDAQRLLADRQAVAVPGVEPPSMEPGDSHGLSVLSPPDMVLHSATHLFYDGEFDRALRDLVDITELLRHMGGQPGFWEDLLAHAGHHQLTRPLLYALVQAERILAFPVPSATLEALTKQQKAGRLMLPVMHAILGKGMRPDHPSCFGPLNAMARFFLYVRGHYLRMPLHLLLPHLAHKGLLKYRPEPVA